MQFVLVCIAALAALGIVAAVASMLTKGGTDSPIVNADGNECTTTHDCAACASIASGECRIGALMEEKKRRQSNKMEEREL